MKLIQLLVVAVLLSNLGMTFGADMLEKESHLGLTVTDVADYQEHQAHDREHKSVSCNSDQSDKNHCPDPCHAGQPHFGHSAFLIANAKVFFAHVDIETSKINVAQLRIDAPFLEGPRRPPKHA